MLRTIRQPAWGTAICGHCGDPVEDCQYLTITFDTLSDAPDVGVAYCSAACRSAAWRYNNKVQAWESRRSVAFASGEPFNEPAPAWSRGSARGKCSEEGCERILSPEQRKLGINGCEEHEPTSICEECEDYLGPDERKRRQRLCDCCEEDHEDGRLEFFEGPLHHGDPWGVCLGCDGELPFDSRSDRKTCSPRCRQTLSRRAKRESVTLT